MTPFEGGLLLLGIFGVPLVLLAIGHRFRNTARRARGAFWGGTVGYGVGLVVWGMATLLPPVLWDEATLRLAGVILPLLLFGGGGLVIGAAIGRTPKRGPHAPDVLVPLLATACCAGPLVAQPPEELFVLREIDAEVLLAETAPGVPAYAFAASVAVLGSEGVLLVDTFHGPTAAEWFLDRIAERTDAPVRWVVNTHAHGDHLWGNAAVLARFPEAEVMAHPNTVSRVASEGAAALDRERARLDRRIADLEARIAMPAPNDPRRSEGAAALARARAQRAEAERIQLAPPTVPVADYRRIDVGGRTVWVQPLPPAHTDGDVVAWIDGILVAGDVIEEGTLWLEGADVRSWALTLHDLARRGPALVIPAHGGLPESIDRAALLHLHRDALTEAVREADKMRPGDLPSADAFAELRADYAEWGVEADAFDAWILKAITAARDPVGTR